MNLDQLEVLVAIVECGSFRGAAEQLHRSQPALSAAVKNIEEELGLLIFDRSEYRPQLTDAGAAFLTVAKSTLDSARYTARVGMELGKQKVEAKLHITADPLISTEVLELIALECARPTLPVNLIIDKSILKGAHQALLKGEIDLAISARPASLKNIEAISLENVTLVAAISRRLLQEKRKASEDFLRQHPQILVYDKRFDEPPDDLLPKAIFKEEGHKMFVPDHFTKLKLIEGGVGWGRISKSELTKNKSLIPIDKNICSEVHLELCLLRPKGRAIGPTAQAIWKVFEKRQGR